MRRVEVNAGTLKHTRRNVLVSAAMSLLLLAAAVDLNGHPSRLVRSCTVRPRKLTPVQREAVRILLRICRGCALPSGAISLTSPDGTSDSQFRISPYFAFPVAMAFVATESHDDVVLARRFIEWAIAHQDPRGYWNDWEGWQESAKDAHTCAAQDSTAAGYLLLLDWWRKFGHSLDDRMVCAAERSVACLQQCTSDAGLTIAGSDCPVAFATSNCESLAGYIAAASLFSTLGDYARCRECLDAISRMSKALSGFWDRRRGAYTWACHSDGTVLPEVRARRPEAAANLYGCTFIRFQPHVWKQLKKSCGAEAENHSLAGIERFAMAAHRASASDECLWRDRLAEASHRWGTAPTSSFRAGVAALVLLHGVDWMPSILAPPNLAFPGRLWPNNRTQAPFRLTSMLRR